METLQSLKVGSVVKFREGDLAVISTSVPGIVTVVLAGGVLTVTADAVGSCVIVASYTDGSFIWRPVVVVP